MTLPEPLERSGFRITRKVFTSPQNAASLDPVTKRKITICNLFVNHRLPLTDIVRLLDEDTKNVIRTLLEQGIVQDRRASPRVEPDQEQKRKLFHPPS